MLRTNLEISSNRCAPLAWIVVSSAALLPTKRYAPLPSKQATTWDPSDVENERKLKINMSPMLPVPPHHSLKLPKACPCQRATFELPFSLSVQWFPCQSCCCDRFKFLATEVQERNLGIQSCAFLQGGSGSVASRMCIYSKYTLKRQIF